MSAELFTKWSVTRHTGIKTQAKETISYKHIYNVQNRYAAYFTYVCSMFIELETAFSEYEKISTYDRNATILIIKIIFVIFIVDLIKIKVKISEPD